MRLGAVHLARPTCCKSNESSLLEARLSTFCLSGLGVAWFEREGERRLTKALRLRADRGRPPTGTESSARRLSCCWLLATHRTPDTCCCAESKWLIHSKAAAATAASSSSSSNGNGSKQQQQQQQRRRRRRRRPSTPSETLLRRQCDNAGRRPRLCSDGYCWPRYRSCSLLRCSATKGRAAAQRAQMRRCQRWCFARAAWRA